MQPCFAGKSFGELSWDSCLACGTLDISWYRGIVVTTIILVSYGGYRSSCVWLSALVKLDEILRLCRGSWEA